MRICPEILERHADEAAFLWERRDRASRSPLVDLEALTAADERLDANLEGLVLGGETGLGASLDALARGPRGALFATTFVAIELGDTMTFARQLHAAERDAASERELVSALGWLPASSAERVLGGLLAPDCPPALHRFGIAGHAVRRSDPGPALSRALESADTLLRARACRAAGELGRRDLLPALQSILRRDEGSPGTAWAAWAAALFGDKGARAVLWRVASELGPLAGAACALAARLGEADVSARLQSLASKPAGLTAALAGAEACGDPACIGWVLDAAENRPERARRAAWVYATITGARLEPPLVLPAEARELTDEEIARRAADVCEDLRPPDPRALRAHWASVAAGFPAGTPHLGGRPITPAWLRECLARGLQPWRHSAAVELFRLAGSGGLFPVHEPAFSQASRLERLLPGAPRASEPRA